MQNRLKQLRERKHLSQAELARQIQITRQALSAIEMDKQDPSLEVALKLAQVLDLPVQHLFFLHEDSAMAPVKTSTLTKFERLMLVNQFRILQALNKDDKDESEYYKHLEEIFVHGYVTLYREALGYIYDEVQTEITDEVLDILSMHRAMLDSLGEKPDPNDVERVKFHGFDANNEGEHLSFARFYTADGHKFSELRVFNSHFPTLQRYRKMLAEWKRMNHNQYLSKEQIYSILEAGTFKH